LIALALVLQQQPTWAADCIVNAHSTARVGAASKGVIADIAVERGDRVVLGQVVAELESSEEQSRKSLAELKASNETPILAARKRAEAAEAKAQRMITLNDRKIISTSELEVAVLEAQTARLEEQQAVLERAIAAEEVRTATAARERKVVHAPFDGVVTARLLSRGELYNEQDPILVIARIDPLHVETFLPVSERGTVRTGQTVWVEMETGSRVEGKVKVIDPVLDAATGTFGVRIEVPNPDLSILVGQRCTTNFSL
jgi:RND family efflux transporter MFP subunit